MDFDLDDFANVANEIARDSRTDIRARFDDVRQGFARVIDDETGIRYTIRAATTDEFFGETTGIAIFDDFATELALLFTKYLGDDRLDEIAISDVRDSTIDEIPVVRFDANGMEFAFIVAVD